MGLELINCVDFRGVDLEVWQFAVGIRISAVPWPEDADEADQQTPTCGFGVYELGQFEGNKTGLALLAHGGARLVSNSFYSGYFGLVWPVDSYQERPSLTAYDEGIPNSRHVYIRGHCHNTQLYSVIMEGAARYLVELADDTPDEQTAEVPSGVLLAGCHLECNKESRTQTAIMSEGRNVTMLGGALWGDPALGTSIVLGEEAGPHLLLNVVTSGQRWFPVEGVAYDGDVDPDFLDSEGIEVEDGVRVFGMYSPMDYLEQGIAFWFPELVFVEFPLIVP